MEELGHSLPRELKSMDLSRPLVVGPRALLGATLAQASYTPTRNLLPTLGRQLGQSIHDPEENAEQEIGSHALESRQSHAASETRESVAALALGLRGRRRVGQRTSVATRR